MNKLLLLAAAGWLLTETAPGQTTGREALTALSREKGASISSQVVLISGERGQDQPASWRVVTRDPEFTGRFREYIIRKGKVAQASPLPAQDVAGLSRTPLMVKRVKVDSTKAFLAADQAAKRALIGFDSIDYELRNKELSQDPVWLVRLTDSSGAAAGQLVISAESGAVLRKTWYETGGQPDGATNVAANGTGRVGQPARESSTSGVGQRAQEIWDGTRNGIEQGKDVVKVGFQRATTSVRGWFGRLRGDTSNGGSTAWENGTYDSSRR